MLKEIEEIALPHGGTDLIASFNAVNRVLEASTIPQKEVVFLTDLQAASWRRPDGAGNEGWKSDGVSTRVVAIRGATGSLKASEHKVAVPSI